MLATTQCDHVPFHQRYVKDETHGVVNFLRHHDHVKDEASCQNTFDGPINKTAM